MKKLTTYDRQLFIAGLISIALIATGSMIGTWIGIIGLCGTTLVLMLESAPDPFEATELQGQLTGFQHDDAVAYHQRMADELDAQREADYVDKMYPNTGWDKITTDHDEWNGAGMPKVGQIVAGKVWTGADRQELEIRVSQSHALIAELERLHPAKD